MDTPKTETVSGYRGTNARDSGIELFRILTMLLIVAHHFVVHSGIMQSVSASPNALRSSFLLVFGAWGKTGINCFVLITGYFMCRSEITLKKFLKLLFEVEFYNVIFYCIFLSTGYESFSLNNMWRALLPFADIGANFTQSYLLFYLFIPFLNILIRNLDEKKHALLALLCLFLYVGLGTLFNVVMNYVSWFIVLYFVASFVRLYPRKIFDGKLVWGLLTLACVFLSIFTVLLRARSVNDPGLHGEGYYLYLFDSNKILAFLTALCAFMFFRNIHFYSRAVNICASATFGILLLHDNCGSMRKWLWQDLLRVGSFYSSDLLPLYAIGTVLCVFLVCMAIELIRLYLIEKPLFRLIQKKRASEREIGQNPS